MPTTMNECPDRVRIGQRIAKAIQEVYRLRDQLSATVPEREKLWAELQNARAEQRNADRELSEHAEKHGCQN